MNEIHKKRLLTLARFLRKLPPEKFNIASWTSECGTIHCALGYCPLVFPNDWEWIGSGKPYLKDGDGGFSAGEEFFGLDRTVVSKLFDVYDSQGRRRRCTPQNVSRRIYEVVKQG